MSLRSLGSPQLAPSRSAPLNGHGSSEDKDHVMRSTGCSREGEYSGGESERGVLEVALLLF